MNNKIILNQNMELFRKANIKEWSKLKNILLSLVIIDFFFVVLHFYSLTLPLTPETQLLRLDMDFSYSEIFQYTQFVFTTIFLAIAGMKSRTGMYFIWSAFFLFLFMDDAFAFHETIGRYFRFRLNLEGFAGLEGQDIGELMAAAILGLLFVLPFFYSIFFGSRKSKEITLHFCLVTGILVFFGVGMDMLHSFLEELPFSGILTIIEDAGEMLAASLILWSALYSYRSLGYSWDAIKKGNLKD